MFLIHTGVERGRGNLFGRFLSFFFLATTSDSPSVFFLWHDCINLDCTYRVKIFTLGLRDHWSWWHNSLSEKRTNRGAALVTSEILKCFRFLGFFIVYLGFLILVTWVQMNFTTSHYKIMTNYSNIFFVGLRLFSFLHDLASLRSLCSWTWCTLDWIWIGYPAGGCRGQVRSLEANSKIKVSRGKLYGEDVR